ncbi:sporulation protein [Streptomyces sp. JJ38]|uniref:sporulation protein n=1 Tax=Streptomyces sp. JJ38 TaxID=2738128 RepID=UPI001C574A4A|nr:sporulation protein [Streptomyces sp. JJ38]MBW1598732.1 sporulation protein [Streptomyces sp. JJ38]
MCGGPPGAAAPPRRRSGREGAETAWCSSGYSDLEKGHIRGTGQKLPFYQEIELHPAPRYAAALNQLEVTFLAGPDGVEVVLEADQRIGGDALNLHRVRHEGVEHRDFTTEVDGWVRDLLRR